MIRHLACIMDGNRRWARKQGLFAIKGHEEGANSVHRAVDFCIKKQIPYLSLYTFSLENFKRPAEEKRFIFSQIAQSSRHIDKFLDRGVRVRFVGDRSLFPEEVRAACLELEERTQDMQALSLNFLFCYGAQQEIVGGVHELLRRIKAGVMREEDVTVETFRQCLWMGDIPEPDLIVRTSGIRRLSNFLLYQAAYSEFCFLDCLWPELTEADLEKAVAGYEGCQRNFGI